MGRAGLVGRHSVSEAHDWLPVAHSFSKSWAAVAETQEHLSPLGLFFCLGNQLCSLQLCHDRCWILRCLLASIERKWGLVNVGSVAWCLSGTKHPVRQEHGRMSPKAVLEHTYNLSRVIRDKFLNTELTIFEACRSKSKRSCWW